MKMTKDQKKAAEEEFDKNLLKDVHRQRIAEKWKETNTKGRPPSSYLGKLKKLHELGKDVTDCHDFPNYGEPIPDWQDSLSDTKVNQSALEELRSWKTDETLNGITRHEECIGTDANDNDVFEVRIEIDPDHSVSTRKLRQEGQKASVAERKSRIDALDLIKRHKLANPNKGRVATSIANWAIEQGEYPTDQKRNLVRQLKTAGAA